MDGNILLSSLGVRVTEPTPGRLASFSARIDSCGRKSALCGKLFFFAWNGGERVVPTHINAVYPSLVSHMWWLGTVCANWEQVFGPRTWTWFRKPLLGLTLRICRTQLFFFTASTTSLIGTLRLPFHLGECCIREAFHAISYTFPHLALLSGTLLVTNALCSAPGRCSNALLFSMCDFGEWLGIILYIRFLFLLARGD